MERTEERPQTELIDLGAASVETRGGAYVTGENEGHLLPGGISDE